MKHIIFFPKYQGLSFCLILWIFCNSIFQTGIFSQNVNREVSDSATITLTSKPALTVENNILDTSEMLHVFLPEFDKQTLEVLWKARSAEEIAKVFHVLVAVQNLYHRNNGQRTLAETNKLLYIYEHYWGVLLAVYQNNNNTDVMRKQILEFWHNSLKHKSEHYIILLSLYGHQYVDVSNIIPEKEFQEQVKPIAWNFVEKTNNLFLLGIFCTALSCPNINTKKILGDEKDIQRLNSYFKYVDTKIPSGKRAGEIIGFTQYRIECAINPQREKYPRSHSPRPIWYPEEIKLGTIIFLDEKTIKEREEAKMARIRAIAEAPELAKRLMLDEPGRLKAMNIIGNIQEPEEVRREMKFALWQYYGIRVNPVPNVKATPKEVQKIRELLKTENEQVKLDILDILSAAQCVSLIPDLFEMCYNKEIPPYRGFGTIAIAPKKTVYFQYSPTQIISYLGDEQVIPELEKLANSATVSEEMKQDALLAINRIKRRKAEEQEQLKRNEEVKRLLAERNIVVAEAGGPTDVKMNPFYDPTHKPDDSRQERPKNSRTWTSLEGWHSLNAVIIRKEADHIILVRDADEKEITVPIKRLSIQDQEYIKNWVSPDKIREHSRTNNL